MKFLAISAVLVALWGAVLPHLAQQPNLRAAIEGQNRRGINPTALYYTDLDAMAEIRSRLQQLKSEHPDAFWRISTHDERGTP